MVNGTVVEIDRERAAVPTTTVDTIVVVDTETTDLDPSAGAEIMELATVSLRLEKMDDGRRPFTDWVLGSGMSTFVETEAEVSPVARAIHHIDPILCRPGRPYGPTFMPLDVLVGSMLDMERPGQRLYAAHNAPFDSAFLTDLRLPWIDTLQCARHLWPDAPRHGNQVLRYWLDVHVPQRLLDGLEAHRALYDAACTAAILKHMLSTHTPAELLRLSTAPLLLGTCGFGKYKDVLWAEVPRDYLAWMVRSSSMYQEDKNIRHTVDHYLGS